ncbi:ABC transporter permease subunit [Zooshikella sp. RANM57]|uniref:ABC transporter permease subunit n=1 Tax=Zooshikella sp. RANM57 TaxID=3425863 RepID=UPI003D6DE6D0
MKPYTSKYSSIVDFSSPALKRHKMLRHFKDKLAEWGVAVGGVGVIVAILLIFLYLLYEVVPLFRSASINSVATYSLPASSAEKNLYFAMEEQAEIGLKLDSNGQVTFFKTNTGSVIHTETIPIPEDASITSLAEADPATHVLALALSNGQVIVFKHEYDIQFGDDNQRTISPKISYPYGKEYISLAAGTSFSHLALRDTDEALIIAGAGKDAFVVKALNKEENFLSGEVTLTEQLLSVPKLPGTINGLLIDPEQRWIFAALENDHLAILDIKDKDKPVINAVLDVTEDGSSLTSMHFLLGGISLLLGDSSGHINQWFFVRSETNEWQLKKIRGFQLGQSAIVSIAPEHRRKGFVAADAQGNIGIFYTTAQRTLIKQSITDQSVAGIAISPRANALLVENQQGEVSFWDVNNTHPEVSWSALWDKVWYESYSEPKYIWQSSAATNDFEPKLSLMPLSFGTLKAAFYAMLLAAPLAICGAIYTAYFMAPAMRRKVKPIIELMEALPTVILGFLAGLWLAPFVENTLAGIFVLLLFMPIGMLLFAYIWAQLPGSIRHRIPDGWQAAILIPVVLLISWISLQLSAPIESLFFGGDIRHWINEATGLNYDQRNALVVGLAMGFAVIPTIFSIAEDAIFSVPKHLTYGSLALGATPWQTLVRVVLLTASPGIFSALMIGLGRAVGETMIVLMATGNTPIMDANIFEGMRTLAANIAVEMPESEVGSSHYRVLFLAALVLFLFTFVVNTLAELIRHRLRKRYSSL